MATAAEIRSDKCEARRRVKKPPSESPRMGRRVVEADLRTRRALGMGERVEGVAIEEVDAGRRVKQEQPSLTRVLIPIPMPFVILG